MATTEGSDVIAYIPSAFAHFLCFEVVIIVGMFILAFMSAKGKCIALTSSSNVLFLRLSYGRTEARTDCDTDLLYRCEDASIDRFLLFLLLLFLLLFFLFLRLLLFILNA